MIRPPAAPAPDELFLRLQAALAGEYSIERELGRGGMGVVYLAREVRLAREVAIKVLPPALAESEAMRAQFLREAQMAARLSHPNIVPIHRVDETAGFVYFVMAYVNGETLAERIRARGPLPPHHAARILREVAWALTYAHSNGIIHRDIKADNILLERGTERALVTDFGIAGAEHTDARGNDGRIAGSPHYVSPEQIAGELVEAASDLYSLGVTGFLALTGRLPFDAPTTREVVAMHLNVRPPSIASLAPTAPAKLSQIIERCLAKHPEHRFPSAAAFAEALTEAVEPPREIPPALRVWLSKTNERDRTRVEIVFGMLLGAVAGIGTAAATQSTLFGASIGAFILASVGAVPSVLRMNGILRAGYGLDDIRSAIREYWVRRREEVVFELSGPSQSLGRGTNVKVFLGGAVLTGVLIALGAGIPGLVASTTVVAMITGTFTVGAAIIAAHEGARLKNVDTLGNAQMKFFNSKWGERFVRLAGWGLKNKPSASSLPQLTEVALGRATDALYDALPKDLRKQLKPLPAAVRRLETDATTLRAEVEKLDASIATLDGDARGAIPSAIADSVHETGVRADREHLLTDLRAVRARAADRLSATVAALENIRLNLLRLQLGDGRVESVTASLEAAQQVAADLGAYADAMTELEETLGPPRTIEPSTFP